MIDVLVGRSLRNLRLKRGLSTRQVAYLLCIDPVELTEFEAGRARPSAVQLHEFALLFGIPIERIFMNEMPEASPSGVGGPAPRDDQVQEIARDYGQRDPIERILTFGILTATAEP
ncbi:helix-turn-helix transcriptional regulator [Litorisediminicola beolgyonensis]|uniref:Helix-turn-helix transcriptional regulator n=1 Tax=Litorisediminicola beolgyonensis TaxID=1173614 RepID=A0ABW3ZDJ1_9RHOB